MEPLDNQQSDHIIPYRSWRTIIPAKLLSSQHSHALVYQELLLDRQRQSAGRLRAHFSLVLRTMTMEGPKGEALTGRHTIFVIV